MQLFVEGEYRRLPTYGSLPMPIFRVVDTRALRTYESKGISAHSKTPSPKESSAGMVLVARNHPHRSFQGKIH